MPAWTPAIIPQIRKGRVSWLLRRAGLDNFQSRQHAAAIATGTIGDRPEHAPPRSWR